MRIVPVLKFLRISALPSAWADMLVGCALLAGLSDSSSYNTSNVVLAMPFLLILSTCLYLGGMGMNDLLHLEKDKLLNKPRPMVTGELPADTAAFVVLFLFVAALSLSLAMGIPVFFVSLTLLVAIAGYNILSSGNIHEGKSVPSPIKSAFSVPTIAICRVLHVTLPFFLFMAIGKVMLFLMASSFVYFCLVTLISLYEDKGGGRRVFALIDLLLIPTVFAMPLWLMTRHVVGDKKQVMYWGALLVLVALLSRTHKALMAAMDNPSPPNVGKAVGTGIRGNCLFMGAIAIAAAPAQPFWGIACIGLFFAGGWLGKYISPT